SVTRARSGAFHQTMRNIAILAVAGAVTLPAWAAASAGELSRQDVQWLDRVTYGPTTATVEEYRKLGRRRFLEEQLHPRNLRLPQPAADEIGALEISHKDGAELLTYVNRENQRINAITDDAQKQTERKTLNDKGNKLAYEAARREILRALYSPAQLQ